MVANFLVAQSWFLIELNSSKNLPFFVVNLYFLCSSLSVDVVIELVYSLVALEQIFHCDKLIQISANLD